MGGMSVMAVACRHPDVVRDRVRRLVLVATAAHGLAAGSRDRFWRIVLWRGGLNRVTARPRLGRGLVRETFGRSPRPAHVEATLTLFVGTDARARRDCAGAMGETDLRAALGAVDMAATVLLGHAGTA